MEDCGLRQHLLRHLNFWRRGRQKFGYLGPQTASGGAAQSASRDHYAGVGHADKASQTQGSHPVVASSFFPGPGSVPAPGVLS